MPKNIRPEILNKSEYGNHKFVHLPGVKLHYVEKGMKNNELLLFIHGFPDFWYSWRNQIPEFSKNYWVVALDLRGYGESEKNRKTSFYNIPLIVDDIKNLVIKLGKEKFTLIAHDWGGVVAHYFIRLHPTMLTKYVLINTVFPPELSGNIFKNTRQFFKSWYILFMQVPYLPEFYFLHKRIKNIKALFKNFSSEEELQAYEFVFGSFEKIRDPLNYYRINFKNWRNEKPPNTLKLNETQIRGLYIHGKKDPALTLRISYEKSFKDVQKIKCVCLPDVGHFAHIETPTLVNKLIKNFLNSV